MPRPAPVFGLRAQLSLFFALFVLVLMAAVGFYFSTHESRALQREIELRGVAILTNVAVNVEDPLVFGEDATLATIVAATKSDNPGVAYCFVTDATSRIAASSEVMSMGQDYRPPAALTDFGRAGYRVTRMLYDGREVYAFASPVRIRERQIGTVYLGISGQAVQTAVASTRRSSLYFAAGAVLVGVIVVFFLASFITRPLERVTEDIVAIGEGNLEQPILVTGQDEIGRIGDAVRDMVVKLRRALAAQADRERIRGELDVAQAIQKAVIPLELPEIPGYELAAKHVPSRELSGDYYDVFEVFGGDRFGLVIADVCGKGAAGSLISMMLRSSLRQEARHNADPQDTVSILHRLLQPDLPDDSFVTLFYLVLDREHHRAQYVNAGHNPALLYRAAPRTVERLAPRGVPLGTQFFAGTDLHDRLETGTRELGRGDVVVLCTDGVTEARSPARDFFGMERLEQVLLAASAEEAKEIRTAILRAVLEFTGADEYGDDLALVVMKRRS